MISEVATSHSGDDIHLFDPSRLTQLSGWAQMKDFLLKRNLLIRPLMITDYDNGLVALINQTCCPSNITREAYVERFHQWKAGEDSVSVVVEDTTSKKVIGTSTLSLELKFIHQCATRGRLEHVVVSGAETESDINNCLVDTVVGLAREVFNCYKITLDCTDNQKNFYAKHGFQGGLNILSASFNAKAIPPHKSSVGDTNYLFDKQLLSRMSSWFEIENALKERNLSARPLILSDYMNGYLELLSQLTVVGTVTRSMFEKRFAQMQAKNEVGGRYATVIIEDLADGKVVGASTLFINHTCVNQQFPRGRLEDVAVLDTHRGKNIGLLVVKIIVELARDVFNCSALSLDCTDDLKKFYAKNGFKYHMNMMHIKFKSDTSP